MYHLRPRELIASLDVELFGPNPLQHSMASIGIALFQGRQLLDTFSVNLAERKGTERHPQTMRGFWDRHPALLTEVTTNVIEPSVAMNRIAEWLMYWYSHGFKVSWVAKPACVDWGFFKSYFDTFVTVECPPLTHYCHDMAAMLRTVCLLHPQLTNHRITEALCHGRRVTHRALDDALAQGFVFVELNYVLEQGLPLLPYLKEKTESVPDTHKKT